MIARTKKMGKYPILEETCQMGFKHLQYNQFLNE